MGSSVLRGVQLGVCYFAVSSFISGTSKNLNSNCPNRHSYHHQGWRWIPLTTFVINIPGGLRHLSQSCSTIIFEVCDICEATDKDVVGDLTYSPRREVSVVTGPLN